jgi:hypothetical protein
MASSRVTRDPEHAACPLVASIANAGAVRRTGEEIMTQTALLAQPAYLNREECKSKVP